MLSALSNEECSVTSEILDPAHGCDAPAVGRTVNGHATDGQQLDSHGQPIYVANIIQDLESDQLGHIDSPETSDTTDALHGDDSLMDDMSSVLGQDVFGADASLTEDSTTLCAPEGSAGAVAATSSSSKPTGKRRSLRGRAKSGAMARMASEEAEEADEENENPLQFGFENIVFEIDNRCDDQKKAQPVRYCSLARFVEGSDIARKSFKKPNMRRSSGTQVSGGTGETEEEDKDEAILVGPSRAGRHISFDDSCKKDDGDEVSRIVFWSLD